MKMTLGRKAYPSESLGCAMGAVGTVDPSTIPARSQAVCLATRGRQCDCVRLAEWVSPLACCPMSFPGGKPSITTFAAGSGKGSGIVSCKPCACGCAPSKGERKSRVRPSLTVNPSKPALCVVPKRATTRGKKVWGRKRHALVEKPRNLLAVKVTGAEKSDHQGGRALLTPLKKLFPRMKLVWGDSHYGGTFLSLSSKSSWAGPSRRSMRSRSPNVVCWYPKGKKWTGRQCFPPAFDLSPSGGSLSAVSPGLSAGVGSAAITRDFRRAVRPSSNSRPALACSPRLCQPSHRDGFQTLSNTTAPLNTR
jgi:hypothetical protein